MPTRPAPVGAQLVRLHIADDRITKVTRAGQDARVVALEPEVLSSATDRPGEDHKPVRLDETPKVLIDAVLAAEDHRFFAHGGVDLRALLRAAWANLRAGRVKEGGSTITQQLVKVRLLSPQRTLFRKLREAWLAALVESRYSKERILEAYLNEIYLGQRGPIAIRGVGAASRAYFGKEVHQLTTPEAALIAAIIRGPNIYSPAVDPDRAREHRNTVLAQMRDLKMITPEEYERARRAPVQVHSLVNPGQSAPYFVDSVRQELEQRFDTGVVARARGSHRDHARPDPPTIRRDRGSARSRSARVEPAARVPSRTRPAPAGRRARGRAGDRRDPRARRRSRLSGEPVQSRRPRRTASPDRPSSRSCISRRSGPADGRRSSRRRHASRICRSRWNPTDSRGVPEIPTTATKAS